MRTKMFAFASRRNDMTMEAFQDHWRHPHGTLARKVKAQQGYIQHHPIACDVSTQWRARYDGIAEIHVASEADAAHFSEDPDYARDMTADEEKFIDRASLQFLGTREDVLVAHPNSTSCENGSDSLWRVQDQSVAICVLLVVESVSDAGWRSQADSELGNRIGAFRHVCCEALSTMHGGQPPFLGVRELWWPTFTAFKRGIDRDKLAWQTLLAKPTSAFVAISRTEKVI